MEGINNLCETLNCGKPAVAFGMKGTAKSRSCGQHMASFLSKGMQIYDIAGYYFITCHNDVQVFEERKFITAKGRGNLTVLETSCESEQNEALQAIDAAKRNVVQAIKDRFEEMKAVVIGAFHEAKTQFAELQSDLEQFLTAKENQLSPSAALLCDMSVVPRFLRFGIADVSDHISAVLSDSWMVSTTSVFSTLKNFDATQKQAVIDSALDEALQYAAKGIQEALWYEDLLIGETSISETQVQVISKLLSWEKVRIEGNLKWLQRSWDMRQRYEFPASVTVKVGQKLANLLCSQLKQFSNAEEILRYCYGIESARDPLSEDAMSLCTDICGVYAASEQSQLLESMGKWTLQTFETSEHPSEHYWTILFYLIYSMHHQRKKDEADALLQYWRKIKGGNKLSAMLQFVTVGINCYYGGNKEEAEQLLLQARYIGTTHFPTSIFTAIALSRLALVSSKTPREQLYKQAQSIYETAAPMSINAAINLCNLGLLCCDEQRLGEAEECYRQAHCIYEAICPKSINAANILNNMGTLFYNSQRLSEAEACYRQPQSVYELTASQSAVVAENLFDLGRVHEAMGQHALALEDFQKAAHIYTEMGDEEMKLFVEEQINELIKPTNS